MLTLLTFIYIRRLWASMPNLPAGRQVLNDFTGSISIFCCSVTTCATLILSYVAIYYFYLTILVNDISYVPIRSYLEVTSASQHHNH